MAITAAGTKTFGEVLGKLFLFWKKHHNADSLIKYTQTTRVEPICIIDKRALPVAYLPDVLQSLNSLFAAYYLQAAALKCDIDGIQPGKLLNSLNPERPFLESLNPAVESLVAPTYAAEGDYRIGLPTKVGVAALESYAGAFTASLEAPFIDANFSGDFRAGMKDAAKAGKEHGDALTAGFKEGQGNTGFGSGDNAAVHKLTVGSVNTTLGKSLTEAANLAVGRVYTVTLSHGKATASIPVMIRLITVECASDLLVHILSDGARTRSSTSKERWFAFRLGELKFWRDIVFCQDLIDEHKKALLKDHTGVYKAILNRRAGNAASAALTQEPSVGTASNIAVLTRETVRELEKEIGGKLDNFDHRQKLFEMSYLMILAVLDADYDHVTFYHRGIAMGTELSVRDIKSANKGSGVDVGDVLKQLMMGNAPSF